MVSAVYGAKIMKDLDLDNEEAVMIACRRYAGKLGVTTDHELNILRILKNSCLEMRRKKIVIRTDIIRFMRRWPGY